MKRCFALLLALCLALPLCACASRTRITSYTQSEWDAVHAYWWELEERVENGGIDSLSPDERLLYIAMSYNGLMLSGGLESVLTYMTPQEIADIPAALRFVGADAHAAQFGAFMDQLFLSPEALQLLSGFWGWLQPFAEQNAAFIALDEERALTSILFAFLPAGE